VSTTADQTPTQDDSSEATATLRDDVPPRRALGSQVNWKRVLAYGLLPAVALVFTAAAGVLKWQDSTARDSVTAGNDALQAAKDGAIALLSYQPGTVDQELHAARGRLTGSFRDSYASLTDDVVIPGAKQKQITAVATVPAASTISATPNRSEALVFVNQTVIIGQDAPTASESSVRITLEKVEGRWLISAFDPT
jgi:Mce-associated membrane protein